MITDDVADVTMGVQAPTSMAECRLCGGEGAPVFSKLLLGKHQVTYYQCQDCQSLQTERPHWLAEAYAAPAGGDEISNLSHLDTGAAQRNWLSLAAVLLVARFFRLTNVLDHGGGDGLLCRLLRDYELNAYVSDLHASPTYALGFSHPNFEVPDLVTAFEVLEHFSDPAAELPNVFGQGAMAVLVSTEAYRGEGPDWWYLTPQTGQHVFFYSERGFQVLAERFGYVVIRSGSYSLFVKPERVTRAAGLMRYLLRGKPLRLFRALIALRQPRGVQRDFEHLRMQSERREARQEKLNG